MKTWFISLTALMALSCSPAGQPTRTLHAPHQRYLERQNPMLRSKSPESPPVALSEGLPGSCKAASQSPLCISCASESVAVHRCYDYAGVWNPEADCHHNNDQVKCLSKDPPFAIVLDYKNSDEKFLQENLKTWIGTVHQIWDEKLTPEEKTESARMMKSLEILGEIITTQDKVDKKDGEKLSAALEGPAGVNPQGALELLNTLSGERLRGKLRLAMVIEGLKTLIIKTHGPSPLLEKFGTMSLEGLEE